MWIGVSGWTYDSWDGAFYQAGFPARRRLEYVSRRFNSVEIDASFYSLLTPETYRRWTPTSITTRRGTRLATR
ncbi:MAG: hypothetical protein DME01_19980 [Candidatus Rokuibacteriota bacterium]|nr:MAG: hypothetical protein DME01_19980 [Candidatus Rokubacteria bacterium]